MKIGALIPARIGSKRLPKKNIKVLGGKPLVCWTIDTLLKSNIFSDVTVSTESDEVSDIIRSRYTEKDVSILKRPIELAGDDSPLTDVKAHYLENRPTIEWYGLFMPTFPFRKIETFKQIQTAILSRHPWVIKTFTTQTFPIMDYYYPVDGGVKRFFNDPCFYARMSHCVYMLEHRDVNQSLWQTYGLSPAERVSIVHADETECIDIDTENDFRVAEKICAGQKKSHRTLQTHTIDNWRIIAPKGTNIKNFVDYLKDQTTTFDHPILILEPPRPPLTSLALSDGAQRRPWISPEAAHHLNSQKVTQTGNMAHMPSHFCHSPYYRAQRDFGSQNYQKPLVTDMFGGRHGLDGSIVPLDRIIMIKELQKQPFWTDPYTWE